jgi:hypothetical protein
MTKNNIISQNDKATQKLHLFFKLTSWELFFNILDLFQKNLRIKCLQQKKSKR